MLFVRIFPNRASVSSIPPPFLFFFCRVKNTYYSFPCILLPLVNIRQSCISNRLGFKKWHIPKKKKIQKRSPFPMGFECKIHLNICCLLQKINLHNKDLYGMNLKSKHWKLVTRVIISFFLKCAFFFSRYHSVSRTEYFDPFFLSHFWFFIIFSPYLLQ